MFDVGKVGQVVGGQDLALHGVHWQRDEGGVGPVLAQASGGGPAARAYTEVITRVDDATGADDFGVRRAALAEKVSQEEILEIIAIVINMTSGPLVDIEGAPVSRAALELDLPAGEARASP